MKNPARYFLTLSALVFTLLSCTDNIQTYIVPIPEYYAEFIKNEKGIDAAELEDVIGKKVVFFQVLDETEIFPSSKEYEDIVIKRIREFGLLGEVISIEELQTQFTPELKLERDQYLGIFRFSKISNREFTQKLKNQFGVDFSLFYQINFWPCEICNNKGFMSMNMVMVNNLSGYVVWVSDNELFIDYDDPELDSAAADMREGLLASFSDSFRPLPHLQFAEALERIAAQ